MWTCSTLSSKISIAAFQRIWFVSSYVKYWRLCDHFRTVGSYIVIWSRRTYSCESKYFFVVQTWLSLTTLKPNLTSNKINRLWECLLWEPNGVYLHSVALLSFTRSHNWLSVSLWLSARSFFPLSSSFETTLTFPKIHLVDWHVVFRMYCRRIVLGITLVPGSQWIQPAYPNYGHARVCTSVLLYLYLLMGLCRELPEALLMQGKFTSKFFSKIPTDGGGYMLHLKSEEQYCHVRSLDVLIAVCSISSSGTKRWTETIQAIFSRYQASGHNPEL